ncbi:MAG: hypothetical protein JWM14_454 [Chitinophagaceae bacterium]|nr:hypothetical protein [Chitinophagaceae bacterium]
MKNYTFLILAILLFSCTKNESDGWHKIQVVDQFGDPVKDEYNIGTEVTGTFSNSSVKDGNLIVKIQSVDSCLFILFHEYGNKSIGLLPEGERVFPKIKTADNKTSQIGCFVFNGYMGDDDKKKLFNLLMTESKPFKIVLDVGLGHDHFNSVYVFAIDPTGFKEAFLENQKK